MTSSRVSVSGGPPQAYAGSGLRREDLRQRGPGPPLLLAVPRPGGRAGRPALRPDPGEQRPNSGGVERQDGCSPINGGIENHFVFMSFPVFSPCLVNLSFVFGFVFFVLHVDRVDI